MLSCINKNLPAYQNLKNKSGLPEDILEAECRSFMDKYGRLPHLDELDGSNSEPHLRNSLHIDSYNGVNISEVIEYTGEDTIENANIALNQQYEDLEIELTPLNKEAIIDILHRPTTDNFDVTEVLVDPNPSDIMIFSQALQKLGKLYGIRFNEVTDAELNSELWRDLVPDAKSTNAFIYNGEIYINTDRHSVDAPIHEMMHMLIGAMRFTDPNLYRELVSLVEQFPNYLSLIKQFPNRSRNDLNEEIFVSEVSRYMAGLSSNIGSMDAKLQHEISYTINRVLDTILMGLDSVKTWDLTIFNGSLKELALKVNSSIMTNTFKGTFNVEGSSLHRKLNNIKSDLMKLNKLKEVCD